MAEVKTARIEREYVIPLRTSFIKSPRYRRTFKAVKTIKKFIAKHMKIPDRDISKIKLDVYLNNDVWFRGKRHPPSKIKVRAVKEDGVVKVDFVDMPEHVKFLKSKFDRRHKKSDKKPKEEKKEEKPETKTEEQVKDEKEKAQSVAEQHVKEAHQAAKMEKHLSKGKEPQIHRMALKK